MLNDGWMVEDDVIIFIFIFIYFTYEFILKLIFFCVSHSAANCLWSSFFNFHFHRYRNAKHLYFECFARIISLLLWIFSFKFICHSSPELCLSVALEPEICHWVRVEFFFACFVRLVSFSVWHRWFWIKVTLFFVIADMHLHNLWIKCRAICISKDYYNVADAELLCAVYVPFPPWCMDERCNKRRGCMTRCSTNISCTKRQYTDWIWLLHCAWVFKCCRWCVQTS